MPESQEKHHPPIRSYVLRQGRMTPGQQRAFAELWPHFGLTPPTVTLEFQQIFANSNPVYLEIGFGNGKALAEAADLHPHNNYLGVEVHGPGVGHLMIKLAEQQSSNVRILQTDAMDLLRHRIPPNSLSGVFLFFPDPWPKKKHHKRRIVQAEFVKLIQCALKPGGYLHMATDWEHYAQQMMAVCSAADGFVNQAGTGNFSPRPQERPLTKFERRGKKLGHRVWDLIFVYEQP